MASSVSRGRSHLHVPAIDQANRFKNDDDDDVTIKGAPRQQGGGTLAPSFSRTPQNRLHVVTVLCQKGLSDIFAILYFSRIMTQQPVNFLEANYAWK